MPVSEHELKKIAKLSHINLDSKTTPKLAHDVSAIMHFVERLHSVDTTKIAPLLHPLDFHQRLRPDQIKEDNHLSELASIAPLFDNGLYLVPKVIETGK